jgi:hypothetical protein
MVMPEAGYRIRCFYCAKPFARHKLRYCSAKCERGDRDRKKSSLD